MEAHKETVIAIIKAAPAWLGVGLAHALDSITWAVVAAAATTIYSAVQTYISIMRYRRER